MPTSDADARGLPIAERHPDAGTVSGAVAIRTLGCKVNRVESERLAATLLAAGVRIVPEEDADVVVVNTCTVTGEADAKARQLVRRELNGDRAPRVVVTGCLVSIDPGALEQLGDRVVAVADKADLAARVAELVGARFETGAAVRRSGEGFRTRAMLKVQDGCDNRCAYCIVPAARGVPRSVPFAEVVREAEELLDAGTRELVLTGVNLGRYDSHGRDLAELVRELDALGVKRLRLSSIEPPDLTQRLVETLGSARSVCPHLHVPLQSGSDQVLAAMGRRYDAETYARLVAAAREAVPGLALTTDVMAGFPGERAQDAEATLAACESIGFARLHVFRYSERPSTPAASMPDAVPAGERARRAAALRRLDRELRSRYAQSREGGEAGVLVERIERGGQGAAPVAIGTSGDYLKVSLPADGATVGDVVAVRLGSAGRDGVFAGVLQGAALGIEC